jgi:Rap1a immunity proteins
MVAMMRVASLRALVLAVAVLVTPVHAQMIDGNLMREACSAAREDQKYAFCLGFLTGAIEAVEWGVGFGIASTLDPNDEGPSPDSRPADRILGYCLPADASMSQIRAVYVAYLDDNPGKLHDQAFGLLHIALIQNYPCM